MTSLASFSAPYVFGGSFRVMTTQIVVSKLNGDIGLAMVETVVLAAVGFAGLYLLRRTEARSVGGTVRGIAPRRGARGRALRPGRRGMGARRAAPAPPRFADPSLVRPTRHVDDRGAAARPRPRQLREPLPRARASAADRQLALDGRRSRPPRRSFWVSSPPRPRCADAGADVSRSGTPSSGSSRRPGPSRGPCSRWPSRRPSRVHRPAAARFVLVGTAAILPLGYLVRSLPLTGRAAFAGLRQMDPALEEAAASLGRGRRAAADRGSCFRICARAARGRRASRF